MFRSANNSRLEQTQTQVDEVSQSTSKFYHSYKCMHAVYFTTWSSYFTRHCVFNKSFFHALMSFSTSVSTCTSSTGKPVQTNRPRDRPKLVALNRWLSCQALALCIIAPWCLCMEVSWVVLSGSGPMHYSTMMFMYGSVLGCLVRLWPYAL